MIGQLFPEQFDNTFRGHKAALWIFGFLLLLKITMGANSTFNGANVAANADGIPLARYSADAARTIVVEFSLLGIATLVLCLIGVLALARYRSMVPLLFALFLAEFLSRRVLLGLLPIPRVGSPPAVYVNLVLLMLMSAGFALSLMKPGGRARHSFPLATH